MHNLVYLILSLIGLGVLIFFHELGHYIVARRVGMTVEVFAIGFGRPIFSWNHRGVRWQLGWIPFGGYVRIKGMEKEGNKEPHEIPDGYFGKNQRVNRIKVALAGPLVNFALAFVFFCMIWVMGGRSRPFSESTQLLGYVSPNSELYQAGLRPGDRILSCNGKPYRNYQSLFEATAVSADGITVEGERYSEDSKSWAPFKTHIDFHIDPDRLQESLGVLVPASYLFVDKTTASVPYNLSKAPLASANVKPGDRLLWVDGKTIFSPLQLQEVMQKGDAFITVQRAGKVLTRRIPRFYIHDFYLTQEQQQEFEDWKYAAGASDTLLSMRMIPYDISPEGRVQGILNFLEEPKGLSEQTQHERWLLPGDQILAIDGKELSSGAEIFKALQTHRFSIIMQRDPASHKTISEKNQDEVFEKGLDLANVDKLASKIGTPNPTKMLGDLYLISFVEPKPLNTFAATPEEKEAYANHLKGIRAKISELQNPELRAQQLELLEQMQSRPILGLTFHDRYVRSNPAPWVAFNDVFDNIWTTLKALIAGPLSPKMLSGPVGIIQVLQGGLSTGLTEGLYWLAFISVNLGLLNLLPIPVLDGGHICFALWEIITGKTISAKTMQRLTFPFAVLLIGFIIYITLKDIGRLLGIIFWQ